MQRIERLIQMLKTKFSEAIRVEDLAEMAHMSPSSIHFHIKEVTSMSPLQYQKRLRCWKRVACYWWKTRTRQAQLIVSAMKARRNSVANIPACLALPLSVMLPIFEGTKD
jgi:methylphosphotriester-DNA--protein-cysteine methyltransferase